MACSTLIHWGSSKEAHIFWASFWMSSNPRTISNSCHQPVVSTTCPLHSIHLSCSPTRGSAGKWPSSSSLPWLDCWRTSPHQALALAGVPRSNSASSSSHCRGLCTGDWAGLSSSRALWCLPLCPWDLLLHWSWLWEGMWVPGQSLVMDQLSHYLLFKGHSGCQGLLVSLSCFSQHDQWKCLLSPPWGSTLHQVGSCPWWLVLIPPLVVFQRGHYVPHQCICPFQSTWQRSGQPSQFVNLIIQILDLFSAGWGPNWLDSEDICLWVQMWKAMLAAPGWIIHSASLLWHEQPGGMSSAKSRGGVALLPLNVGTHPETSRPPSDIPSPRWINPWYPSTPWQQGIYLTYPCNAIPVGYDN